MRSSLSINIFKVARLSPALAGLFVLALYLATMPHGLTWDLGGSDGGELATGVYTLGLVHSPGYPTYLLLAQVARLIPVTSFAWRLNIFSALCASGTVTLLGYTMAQVVAGDEKPSWSMFFVGGMTGLAFGLVEVVWSQAIITEVYSLAALFCAAILHTTFRSSIGQTHGFSGNSLLLLALLAGLGMGSHYMVGFVILFAALYLSLHRRQAVPPGNPALLVAAFVIGLGVFAYLPLRAGRVPASNWGNPDTLKRFLHVVSGADYAARFSPRLALQRFAPLIKVIAQQLSWPGIALAVLGCSIWWDERRPLIVTTLAIVVLNLAFTAGYAAADTLPYLYPTLFLLTLAAGTAIHTVAFKWLHAGRRWALVAGIGLVFMVTVPLMLRGMHTVATATTTAEIFGQEVVNSAPDGSLVLSESEQQTFAIRYAAIVIENRPDLILIDTNLLHQDWFRYDLARFYPQLGLDPSAVAGANFDSSYLLANLPPGIPIVTIFPPE